MENKDEVRNLQQMAAEMACRIAASVVEQNWRMASKRIDALGRIIAAIRDADATVGADGRSDAPESASKI